MTRSCALLGAILLFIVCAATTSAKTADKDRCIAAEALVSAVPSNEGVAWFSLSPPSDQFSWKRKNDPNLSQNWIGETPRPVTIAAFRKATVQPALSCENAKARATGLGLVLGGEEGVARLKKLGLNGEYQYFHTLTLPIVEGNEAISISISASNQLGGAVKLVLLKRTGKSWQAVGSHLVGVG